MPEQFYTNNLYTCPIISDARSKNGEEKRIEIFKSFARRAFYFHGYVFFFIRPENNYYNNAGLEEELVHKNKVNKIPYSP